MMTSLVRLWNSQKCYSSINSLFGNIWKEQLTSQEFTFQSEKLAQLQLLYCKEKGYSRKKGKTEKVWFTKGKLTMLELTWRREPLCCVFSQAYETLNYFVYIRCKFFKEKNNFSIVCLYPMTITFPLLYNALVIKLFSLTYQSNIVFTSFSTFTTHCIYSRLKRFQVKYFPCMGVEETNEVVQVQLTPEKCRN